MNAETETMVWFLDAANRVAEGAPRPSNPGDAADVLASLHQLIGTTEAAHDQIAECFGPIDEAGRCAECGRLVVLGMWRAHREGGCLMAIPFVGTALWLVNHREGIPLVGRLIWRYRRTLDRRTAPTSPPTEDRS